MFIMCDFQVYFTSPVYVDVLVCVYVYVFVYTYSLVQSACTRPDFILHEEDGCKKNGGERKDAETGRAVWEFFFGI